MPFHAPGNRHAPSDGDGTQTTSPAAGGYRTRGGAVDSSASAFTPLGIGLDRLTISLPPTATVSGGYERELICLFQLTFSSHVIPPVSSMKFYSRRSGIARFI